VAVAVAEVAVGVPAAVPDSTMPVVLHRESAPTGESIMLQIVRVGVRIAVWQQLRRSPEAVQTKGWTGRVSLAKIYVKRMKI
jgi:hypothetical protein